MRRGTQTRPRRSDPGRPSRSGVGESTIPESYPLAAIPPGTPRVGTGPERNPSPSKCSPETQHTARIPRRQGTAGSRSSNPRTRPGRGRGCRDGSPVERWLSFPSTHMLGRSSRDLPPLPSRSTQNHAGAHQRRNKRLPFRVPVRRSHAPTTPVGMPPPQRKPGASYPLPPTPYPLPRTCNHAHHVPQ